MQACDGLDGVRDGVISHQAACNAQFDPARAKLNGKPLRCPGGADTSQRCLSDAQIHALRVFNSPIRFNFPLASGGPTTLASTPGAPTSAGRVKACSWWSTASASTPCSRAT